MTPTSGAEDTGIPQRPEMLITALAEGDVPTKEIRRVAACVNVLARYGLERANVWEVAKIWKANRIRVIGYQSYIFEVLGSAANCRLADCRLWRDEEELDIKGLSYWPGRPLVDYLCFLAAQFDGNIDDLPTKVEVNRNGSKLTTLI
jgi:hypothetical protein